MLGRLGVRRGVALAILVASTAVMGSASGSAPRCSIPDQVVSLSDDWIKIAAPSFSTGGAQLVAYDVAQISPDYLVATNGNQVSLSYDGGCDWHEASITESAAVPTLPLGEGDTVQARSLTQVKFAAVADAPSSQDVWAIGQTTYGTSGGPVRPRLLYSANFGAQFVDRANSFPASVLGTALAVAPGTRRGEAALLFQQTFPRNTFEIYETKDGGATWSAAYTGLSSLSGLALDRVHHQVLAWGTSGLLRGGLDVAGGTNAAALVPVPAATGGVTTVTLLDGGSSFTAYLTSEALRLTSDDGGVTVRPDASLPAVKSAAQGPLRGLVAQSNEQTNVFVEAPHDSRLPACPTAASRRSSRCVRLTASSNDFSPRSALVSDVKFVEAFQLTGRLRDLTFPLYALNASALFRRDIPVDLHLKPVKDDPTDVSVHDVRPVRRVATLTPQNTTVSLLPGQAKTVDFAVGLPPNPTPLDVFFMTDSTGSMGTAIESVQTGIQQVISHLAATGIDVQFGVADFRDYQQEADPTRTAENYPYLRRYKVSKVGPGLADALMSISTGGGTVDHKDSALEATYQAVTGAGRANPIPLQSPYIASGQDAGFRPEAMKVVVVAADAAFRHPSSQDPTYPGPSLETVSQALQDRGVHYVGIEVSTNPNETARPDMEQLARETHTLAPAGGIDCNNDGVVDHTNDVGPLKPIVCPFAPDTGDSIAPVFVALLEGIRDYAAVDLSVAGDPAVARPLAATHFPKVNLKAPSDYRLPVQFSCDAAHAGTTNTVAISAISRGQRKVSAVATVRCLVPEPPAKQLPLILVPALIAAPAPPPPPPPGNSPPNPNPNPNPQPNANAGAATNEEDQAQLATAENDQGENIEGNEEVAFSARRTDRAPLPDVAWVGLVMLMSTAAFGTHLARRHSTWGQLRTQESR